MNEKNLREIVITHLLEATDEDLSNDSVTDASTLKEDLNLSSLQAVTLIMDLEDEFKIAVEDEELEELTTVGDLLALIAHKRSESS